MNYIIFFDLKQVKDTGQIQVTQVMGQRREFDLYFNFSHVSWEICKTGRNYGSAAKLAGNSF